MYFYEVLVSSQQFHGKEPLTYSSESNLPIGSIVNVPLRNTPVVGAILRPVPRPSFATKPLHRVIIPQPLPAPIIQLLEWIRTYYPAPLGILAQLILPGSLVRKRELPPALQAVRHDTMHTLPPLSNEQHDALTRIAAAQEKPTVVLHGNTGTGKTRLYMELALDKLGLGKSVLILTPEIGLTPQMETTLRASIPYPVITIHSNLTPAERRTVWLQVLQASGPIVVMGPRSALFSPLHNIGLIVVDEAHDQAYKQEQAPHYQATRVASQLARLHQALLVFGTATPLITEYYLAQATQAPIIRLTHRPAGEVDRSIEIISLHDRAQFPRQPHLSLALLKHIHQAMETGHQALVFLNRRGTARLVMCQMCGWHALCPHCDVPLTYHQDTHNMRCHTCGYHLAAPSACPECNSPDIIFKSIGTKSIVTELQKEFPGAVIRRFDTDNLKVDRLEQHYHDIQAGKVDILVGTQMLAKGLDLPKLAVVGVVIADTSLYFPDYTAEERTYQLLTQVIGRVGRGHTKGSVVIQTYSPDSPAIQAAVKEDWKLFYQQQLDERKKFGFPPFVYTLKLSCTRASTRAAETASHKLVTSLRQTHLRVAISDPSPSFHEKQAGKYRWQVLIKAKNRNELLKIIPLLPANWSYDLDPSNLL